MDLSELIKTIRDEKLYDYKSYKIGPPEGEALSQSLNKDLIVIGIYSDEKGIFKFYEISQLAGIRIKEDNLTEEKACNMLLNALREAKDAANKIFTMGQKPISEKNARLSYKIALSGITVAISVLCLVAAFFIPYGSFTFLILSSMALLIPLSKRFYFYSLLTYIATALFALIIGIFMPFTPYALFFGLHPILTVFMRDKKVNKILAIAIKHIFYNGSIIAIYFITKSILTFPTFLIDYWYVTIIALNLILFVYDELLQRLTLKIEKYIDRIKK